ncbi:unnamed protein product, partial [Ectocarpus fasciculatus]
QDRHESTQATEINKATHHIEARLSRLHKLCCCSNTGSGLLHVAGGHTMAGGMLTQAADVTRVCLGWLARRGASFWLSFTFALTKL